MITADELAWKLQDEWILPLSQEELKAFDKLAKEYGENKISRAYSTGSGAVVVVRE